MAVVRRVRGCRAGPSSTKRTRTRPVREGLPRPPARPAGDACTSTSGSASTSTCRGQLDDSGASGRIRPRAPVTGARSAQRSASVEASDERSTSRRPVGSLSARRLVPLVRRGTVGEQPHHAEQPQGDACGGPGPRPPAAAQAHGHRSMSTTASIPERSREAGRPGRPGRGATPRPAGRPPRAARAEDDGDECGRCRGCVGWSSSSSSWRCGRRRGGRRGPCLRSSAQLARVGDGAAAARPSPRVATSMTTRPLPAGRSGRTARPVRRSAADRATSASADGLDHSWSTSRAATWRRSGRRQAGQRRAAGPSTPSPVRPRTARRGARRPSSERSPSASHGSPVAPALRTARSRTATTRDGHEADGEHRPRSRRRGAAPAVARQGALGARVAHDALLSSIPTSLTVTSTEPRRTPLSSDARSSTRARTSAATRVTGAGHGRPPRR